MNEAQFKDPDSHMSLAVAVVASWSVAQEVTGLSPFNVMINLFVTELSEFSETFRKNSNDLETDNLTNIKTARNRTKLR